LNVKTTFLPSLFSRTILYSVTALVVLVSIVIFLSNRSDKQPEGDRENGGLFLPGGFNALVVVDSIGKARHLAVNENGDIYVKLRDAAPKQGNVALRDIDGDGKADSIAKFGDYEVTPGYGPTGMRIYNGYLYFSTGGTVFRNKLTTGKLVPESKIEVILTDDYKNDIHHYEHIAKPMAFDDQGNMYVPFGSPGDCCQVKEREPGSLGEDPCPELEEHGGIWQFRADKTGQTIKQGKRYATGIRSAVAIDWNHHDNTLYAVQQGRDNLFRSWPELYSQWQSALLPSEEFLRIKEGTDAGWPYYYYDQMQGKKLLNPEYGGDGKKEGKGREYAQPLHGFPGHFAPNDLLFYTGDQFPERYKNGAFIAFHGSTIRAPYSQGGYFIGFVPFKNGAPSGPWEVFADGFAGVDTIVNTSNAAYRPMGLAIGPDGSLYISDSEKGKIWRVMYKGDKKKFGPAELAEMQKRKETQPNIKTPDEVTENLERGNLLAGGKLYTTYCGNCHQGNGKGDGTRYPPLDNSEWVRGDTKILAAIVLNGLSGPITVNGVGYNGVMPANSFLKDEDIALILSYVRQNFKNNAGFVKPELVARVRRDSTNIKRKV